MTRRQRQSQPKPVHKPLFCTRTEATRSIHAMSTSSNSVDPSLPVEPQPRSITSTSSYTQASQLRRFGGISLNSIVLSSTKQASGAQNQIEGLTSASDGSLVSLKTTMTQFNETAQIKYGDNVEGIESSALSNDLNDAPFAPTIAKSPTSLPVGNSSVVSKPTSTPRGQGPRTESTTTEIPQTQGHTTVTSFRKPIQIDQPVEPSVSLQDKDSPVGNVSCQLDHVYQSVCKIVGVPTTIPPLIPASTSLKTLSPELRLYQYHRGEELDHLLAELAEEFVPTYIERNQMLEWIWKLESNRVRTYFGNQAGALPYNARTWLLQCSSSVYNPTFPGMPSEAAEIMTSELCPLSPDRIRTAYNCVRIISGSNILPQQPQKKESVKKEAKPVKQPPKQHGRAQSANIKPNTSTEVPVRTQSMPASQMEVSPRSKYIPLFATKSAVTSPVRSATPETTFVDADEMGSTMNASNVPTTPKKKAKRTARKVPSPSSSIVDLLACDRNSPVLAAIMKKWAQKNVPSNRTSPTKPRKPRSKKLPTVDPAEEPRQQPGMVVQSNALDCELLALLNETTNEELASMSTITSRNPSPDPFCNMEAYFQTQPPINFDSSFSATVPNCLSFPPLTTTELFAFDPIGLTIGSRSTGVTDFGHFGFQSDFSFLASGGPHSIEDVVSGPFSFGGIGDGMFSLPSSPNNALGGDTAAMVLDQVEAAQAMDLNDLFSL